MLKLKNYIFLVVTFFVYSLSLLFSKFASMQVDSLYFFIFYGISVSIMVLYAILWQLILKKTPLNIAFSFKSITVIFSIILGSLFFGEIITFRRVISVFVICIGIILIGYGNES